MVKKQIHSNRFMSIFDPLTNNLSQYSQEYNLFDKWLILESGV